MLVVVVAEGVAIALLALLVLGLLRSHALILRALHDLGAGLDLEPEGRAGRGAHRTGGGGHAEGSVGPVPVDIERGVQPATRPDTAAVPLEGTTLDGEEVTIPVAGEGRRTLVAFLSSGCGVCQTFWDELSSGVPDVPGDARLVVLAKDPREESVSRLRELAGPSLEVVQSTRTWESYGVPGSPYFVYVEDGAITGEGSSTSWAQVRDLMAQSVRDTAEARRRAARSGRPPGAALGPMTDLVDVARADRELLGAGIRPGHPSLYENPDAEPAEQP